MPSSDECRDLVGKLDDLAKLKGYRDFAELVAKINVKTADEALKLIEAMVLYRKCKALMTPNLV